MSRKLQYNTDFLMCPRCGELLTREDIEGYGHCCYCDHAFELDRELEDFLLRPVVQQWVKQARTSEDAEIMF
ncbi:MAG: hypothetical protein BWZ02_01256 [Lentisphaerae bacterium ADurb.BinA184]|nr:MAG: hypothetical protein BWZ02_01256 [Lentisphaerae bacterium ADurb.BinA184]